MSIIIDQVKTHDLTPPVSGDNTVPPGITGTDWCHICSDTSLLDLTTFLTVNLLTIGCSPTNVRTPLLGSNVTYAGLNATQRAAAIAAGASPQRQTYVIANVFDAQSPPGTYEP